MSAIDTALLKDLTRIGDDLNNLKTFFAFSTLGSTNDYAQMLAKTSMVSGAVIVAASQYQGRGRLMRTWHMQNGDIALSVLLCPRKLPSSLSILPMVPALAIAEAFSKANMHVHLKWPNDIVAKDKNSVHYDYCGPYHKIGGILIENVFTEQKLTASIVGIGLNLVKNEAVQKEVPHATSIEEQFGHISRHDALSLLLNSLDDHIDQFFDPRYERRTVEAYSKICVNLGRKVTVKVLDVDIVGNATHIREDGSLIIDDGNHKHAIFSGDIGWVSDISNR